MDSKTFDLSANTGTFTSTTVNVAAVTDAGRAFLARHLGTGCVGFEIPKSNFWEVVSAARVEGVTIGG